MTDLETQLRALADAGAAAAQMPSSDEWHRP